MTPRHLDIVLLRVLRAAGARFISREELLRRTGSAVDELTDRLGQLREVGYCFDEEPASHGLRLVAAPEQLVADDLRASLSEDARIGQEILVFQETNSTNDLAAKAGDDGMAEGLAIFAESQRAGRGRLGRKWSSPPYQGLWFSLLLRPVAPVERWPELTFCAALAVAETAEQLTGLSATVKWPNDVLLGGRKIAGILLECHHRSAPGFVVVGIGINVRQQTGNFAPELRERAGSLAMAAGQTIDRRSVAVTFFQRFEQHYLRWPDEFGFIMDGCTRRGCLPV